MKKILAAVVVSSLILASFPVVSDVAASNAQFKDISSHWAKSAIEASVEAGFVKGYPDGSFKPNANVSRAEFLAIVTRASKLVDLGGQEDFDDVTANHWAIQAINNAIGTGFINPADFGKSFEPNKALTRAEMVKWLVNGLVKSDPSFAQALMDTENTILPFTEFYKDGFQKSDIPCIAVAHGAGLVGGFPDGSFGPEKTTTRAEVVVLLSRYLKVEGTKAEQYKGLNELREVGTTGTNVLAIANGNVSWSKNFQQEIAPIYTLFNKDIKIDKNIGTMQAHHFIIIDPTLTSIYRNMFADTELQKWAASNDVHLFFSEMTVTLERDLAENKFGELTNVAGTTIRNELPELYGYKAIKATGSLEFLKKGASNRFWSRGVVMDWRTVDIYTTDGKVAGFRIER